MTIQRKVSVAALALSLPLAALGQAKSTPSATIYGTLNVNLQTTEASGATATAQNISRREAVSVDSSNVGVRVDAEVVNGLHGLAQCETSASVNGNGVSGICNRNSRVGLSGNWGTVFYGNWDTPYKGVAYGTKVDDPFLDTDVFGYQGLMSSPGFNYRSGGWVAATGGSIHGFDVRGNNAVGYWSPKWNGVGVKAQISVDSFANATGTQDPWLYSLAVNYDAGPLSVLGAYERHDDGFGLVGINNAAGAAFGSAAANTAGTATNPLSTTDTAWRLGAGYEVDSKAGATTVGVLYEQLGFKQEGAPVGAVSKYDRSSFQLAAKHRFGPHEFRARFSLADSGSCSLAGGAPCSTSGYGAHMLALGYAYYLASNMQAYLSFAQITNDRNAQYTFGVGGSTVLAGATPRGADPLALGLGLRYAF